MGLGGGLILRGAPPVNVERPGAAGPGQPLAAA